MLLAPEPEITAVADQGILTQPMPVVVVAACTESYAAPLAVRLHSALSHVSRDRAVTAYVLDCGIGAESLERIKACLGAAHPKAQVVTVPLTENHFAGLTPRGRYPLAVFARLFIAEVLPRTVSRVLYIDSDTVVTEDVAPLFDLDMAGFPLMAVRDVDDAVELVRLRRDFPAARLGPSAGYMNAGVLLMDLTTWRDIGLAEQALDVLRLRGTDCPLLDQDAINIVAAEDWQPLPEKWNNQIFGKQQVFAALPDAAGPCGILHYIGKSKPWKTLDVFAIDAYLEASIASRYYPWTMRFRLAVQKLIVKSPWTLAKLRYAKGVKRRLLH